MNKTAIFRDDLFLEHDPGFEHIESPERLQTIYAALDAIAEKQYFIEPSFSKASLETLLLNHSRSLIDRVAATAEKVYCVLDEDTFTSKKTYAAACLAAGALVCGVDLLFKGQIDTGFALVRPPGHHAEKEKSMGFCIFNNVALAAHHAIKYHGVQKILIVDWDVHHGNGTQNSFYDTDKVLFVSLHQSGIYPGSGFLQETGAGRGEGYTINIPLPGGQGDREYANIFNTLITPLAHQYKPELILVSAGFDGYYGDGASAMCLTCHGYAYMTRVLVNLAEELCGGKILVALEGGYSLQGLGEGVFAVLGELAGARFDTPLVSHLEEGIVRQLTDERDLHPAVERARDIAKKFWKM